MKKTSIQQLCRSISELDKGPAYSYISRANKGRIRIIDVVLPNGPIAFKRWNPSKGENENDAQVEHISPKSMLRIATAIQEDMPFNIDRILGASYNFRSVLEALLAHTPEFYYCYPGRVETDVNRTEIKKGHKHLLWQPDRPHPIGEIHRIDTDMVISEVPSKNAIYEALSLPDNYAKNDSSLEDIEIIRRHAQIQFALVKIGHFLDFRTYVARNDQGIICENKRLGEHPSVVVDLSSERMLKEYPESVRNALLIDCIWFKNGRLMPAVIEIEHSTGVTSGLTRMMGFKNSFPPFPTRYVIAAPDELRDKVFRECTRRQFRDLNAKFFPYSAVEELYGFLSNRKVKGITDEFIDSFMENTQPHLN